MHFYNGNGQRAKCIMYCYRCMCIGCSIQYNTGSVFPGILNQIDDLTFAVALVHLKVKAMVAAFFRQHFPDLGQRHAAIDFRLPVTKQIQRRAIYAGNKSCHVGLDD